MRVNDKQHAANNKYSRGRKGLLRQLSQYTRKDRGTVLYVLLRRKENNTLGNDILSNAKLCLVVAVLYSFLMNMHRGCVCVCVVCACLCLCWTAIGHWSTFTQTIHDSLALICVYRVVIEKGSKKKVDHVR
jgi:hypothetical protein